MALIKFGGGVIQMSGSIAGNTFARNRYGNYVRARTKPTNPNTARQVAVRAALAMLTERWAGTLTAVQRTAWNLYASNVSITNRLGEAIKLSGYNHYLRSNVINGIAAATIIDDGPVVFEIPEQDPTFAITASEATQLYSITFDNTMDWADEDGAFLWYSMGQPQNAQRNFFAGPWRWGGGVVGVNGAPPASPIARGGGYAIAEGQHVWIYGRIQRADGRLSTPFEANVIVAA